MERRKSKQREEIYKIIKSSNEHPTTLMVYDEIRKKLPSTSIGNVYRNIRILVEEERIKCWLFADGIERYDAITGPHYHFTCKKCHKISDFDMPIQNKVTELAQKLTGDEVTSHVIQFYGICKNCKNDKIS